MSDSDRAGKIKHMRLLFKTHTKCLLSEHTDNLYSSNINAWSEASLAMQGIETIDNLLEVIFPDITLFQYKRIEKEYTILGNDYTTSKDLDLREVLPHMPLDTNYPIDVRKRSFFYSCDLEVLYDILAKMNCKKITLHLCFQ